MKVTAKITFWICFLVSSFSNCFEKNKKIIALIPGRNEARYIPNCFRNVSEVVDSIVYLDDASTDNSVEIARSLQEECRVERIIEKEEWYRDEPGDRNKLLEVGRSLGGTHFIVIDLDELFTAPCLENNFLRRKILKLCPGERLVLPWIQLWKGLSYHRVDSNKGLKYQIAFIFCDDGKSVYTSHFIHTPRSPQSLGGKKYSIKDYNYGVLHFAFVNWRNLLVKHHWYRCLERIRFPEVSTQEINQRYKGRCLNETQLKLEKVSDRLMAASSIDYSVYNLPEIWREKQILEWFDTYGKAFFIDLKIWDIVWGEGISN